MEEILHYVWKHKLFGQLQTIKGESIEVIDVGLPNSNTGPDFFNSKLKIGDQVWEAILKYTHLLKTGTNTNMTQTRITTL